MFITQLFQNPRLFFAAAVIVIFSVCCHEFMHAWVALQMGDATAAERGHLTLNPLKQMGWFSLLLFCFIGIVWGQVPVNPARMRGRYAPVWTAAAGPATNLLLSLLFTVGVYLAYRCHAHKFALYMLTYGAEINFVLAVFNLLPIPGLDGWSIMHTFFPRIADVNAEWVKGAYFMLIVLLFVGFDYLYKIAAWVLGGVLRFLLQSFGGAA